MRIALLAIADSVHGTRWANAFAQRQHEVHLLTSHEPANPLVPGVILHRLPFRHPVGYFVNVWHVRKLLREIAPDVLNTHFASGYGTLARLSGFQPNVLSVWGTDVYDFPHKSAWHGRLIRANLSHAQHICSTSHAMAAVTRQLLPGLQIDVVPFGIDTEQFKSAGKKKSGGTITVGTVKTLLPKYGIDVLIRAFALVQSRLAETELASQLRLKIVGGGPDLDSLKRLADSLNVAEATEFTGRVPHSEVPRELNSFDVYAALSRDESESFGVAVLEASACELPVLVTNVGGLPEVVKDGVTGIVVANEDVEAAADGLLQLVVDQQLSRSMGHAGRELVQHKYEWSRNVEQMEQILAAAAAQGSG